MSLRLWMGREALGFSLAKVSPSMIPLSNREEVITRDYCTSYLSDDRHRYVLRYLNTRGARAAIIDKGDGHKTEGAILNSGIADLDFSIVQYFREIEIRYDSAAEFILHQFIGFKHFAWARDQLAQLLFNGRRLHRRDRTEILRVIAEATIRKENTKFSEVSMMSELYGVRWVRHPGADGLQKYCGLILESLAAAGDLDKEGYQFSLAPGGLKTLADYELEERRHRDNRARQTGILVLTLVLALIGAAQAWQGWTNNQAQVSSSRAGPPQD